MKKLITAIVIGLALLALTGWLGAGSGWVQGPGPTNSLPLPAEQTSLVAPALTQSHMVASEGGIIILVGDQLFKYNTNLELLRRERLPVDYQALQQKILSLAFAAPALVETRPPVPLPQLAPQPGPKPENLPKLVGQ